MRIAVAALCVLALTGSAEAEDCSNGTFYNRQMPPEWARQQPTVPFVHVFLPAAKIKGPCGRPNLMACSFPQVKAGQPDRWVVVIDAAVTDKTELACLEIYERAHMPPNKWGDPAVEPASVMRRLHLSDQPQN